jgi:hypothetical protein
LEIVVREVQEGVDGVQTSAVDSDLTEGLADDGFVGAGDDLGVEEVTVPHPHAESAVVVLPELPAVLLVGQQRVAFDLVAQMQCRRAGTEFLEHHQVDAVGVDLERHRQMLPAEVAAEPVDQSGHRAEHGDGQRVGLDVGRRQQAGLELVAQHRK